MFRNIYTISNDMKQYVNSIYAIFWLIIDIIRYSFTFFHLLKWTRWNMRKKKTMKHKCRGHNKICFWIDMEGKSRVAVHWIRLFLAWVSSIVTHEGNKLMELHSFQLYTTQHMRNLSKFSMHFSMRWKLRKSC